MQRSSFQLGNITVNCFKSESGEYLYSLTDVSAIINKSERSAREFIASKTFKANADGSFQPAKHTESNVIYSLVPSWVVTKYLFHHAFKNRNELAMVAIAALTTETLDNRAAMVLDESRYLSQSRKFANISNDVIAARTKQLEAKIHRPWQLWTQVVRIHAGKAHDYLTTQLVGRTAKESRCLPVTYPGNPSVGLNHWYSDEGTEMDLVTLVKMYCATNLGKRKNWTMQQYLNLAIDEVTKPLN